jgi:translation initiation factor 3 subunit M
MWNPKSTAETLDLNDDRRDSQITLCKSYHISVTMPGPSNTLLIEGSFSELSEELAQYLDTINKTEEGAGIQSAIAPLVADIREKESSENFDPESITSQKDDILKHIVGNAAILNTAPEKEFIAAYNLLIHLSNQTPNREQFFSRVCKYLSEKPVSSSPQYGPSLAVNTLTTIFNVLPLASESRYHVFLAILEVIKRTSSSSSFEALVPQLEANVTNWLSAWQLDDEDARNLHLAIADLAAQSGNPTLSFTYLLHALETIPPTSASEDEARSLAKRTLSAGLTNPSVTDFTPLTASDAVQALRKSDPNIFELLEIFSSSDYSEYTDFLETNSLSSLSLPDSAAEAMSTKMRELTLASIAAASSNRAVPYSTIATALQVPKDDVEMWVIDSIRAGLVEGKLSQLKQEFLVQRATYRVFGEKQWAEIQGRLMVWRRSLENVLSVVRTEKEKFLKEGPGMSYAEEQDQRQQNGYSRGGGGGGGDRGGRGGGRGGRQQREPREPREVDFSNIQREE